jgi:hypothetical protein
LSGREGESEGGGKKRGCWVRIWRRVEERIC